MSFGQPDHIDRALRDLELRVSADRERRAAGVIGGAQPHYSPGGVGGASLSPAHHIVGPSNYSPGGTYRSPYADVVAAAAPPGVNLIGARNVSPRREVGRIGQSDALAPPLYATSGASVPRTQPQPQTQTQPLPYSPPAPGSALNYGTSPSRRVMSDTEIFALAQRSTAAAGAGNPSVDSWSLRRQAEQQQRRSQSPSDGHRIGPASNEYRLGRQSPTGYSAYSGYDDATPPARLGGAARPMSPKPDRAGGAGSGTSRSNSPTSLAKRGPEGLKDDVKTLRSMFVIESMVRREGESRAKITEESLATFPRFSLKGVKPAAAATTTAGTAGTAAAKPATTTTTTTAGTAAAKPTTTTTTTTATTAATGGAAAKPATTTTTTGSPTKPATTTTTTGSPTKPATTTTTTGSPTKPATTTTTTTTTKPKK